MNIYILNSIDLHDAFNNISNSEGLTLVKLVHVVAKEVIKDNKRINVHFVANPSFSLVSTWSVTE